MNGLRKILMIWLLAIAIPVQGLAAGMQFSCGPMHHGAIAKAVGEPAVHQHHHQMLQHAGAADQGAQHDHSVAKNEVKHAGACSACAACCVGAAVIPSPFNFVPVHSRLVTRVIEPSSLFAGHIPSGLERPPRFILS